MTQGKEKIGCSVLIVPRSLKHGCCNSQGGVVVVVVDGCSGCCSVLPLPAELEEAWGLVGELLRN